jgi:hypothetical protein
MLAALDRWGEWKRMREAPARMDEIERRLSALESAPKKMPGRPCPACGAPGLRRKSSDPHPEMPLASLGVRIEKWVCDECGEVDEKQVTA